MMERWDVRPMWNGFAGALVFMAMCWAGFGVVLEWALR
jgi:hypothetical protein